MPRVEVYYNLHKHLFSVRDAKSKRVVDHTHQIMLDNVYFRVQPAGRDKVRATGRKNVHAYVSGNRMKAYGLSGSTRREITYNPYKYDSFVYVDDLTPVEWCGRVFLQDRRMWEVKR